MAQKLYEESNIQAIADAIRAKGGTSATMKTSEMANAISGIPSGGGVVRKTGSFTIDADSESYTFSTGLSTVHSVMVRGSTSHTADNTFGWYYDDESSVSLCVYGGQYVAHYGANSKVSISGGDVTCNQYNSTYPIVNKTFKWVAYGE